MSVAWWTGQGRGPGRVWLQGDSSHALCFSHLLSSQYVERHFSPEGAAQHSTVSPGLPSLPAQGCVVDRALSPGGQGTQRP